MKNNWKNRRKQKRGDNMWSLFKIVAVIVCLCINPILGLGVAWALNGFNSHRSVYGNVGDVIGGSAEDLTKDWKKRVEENKREAYKNKVHGGSNNGGYSEPGRGIEIGAMNSSHWE